MERERMRSHRAAPILVIGFGILIALIAITGIGALERGRDTYRDVNLLNEQFRHTEDALDGIGAGIYEIGLLTRDYLLSPSPLPGEQYRAQLLAQRSSIDQQLK